MWAFLNFDMEKNKQQKKATLAPPLELALALPLPAIKAGGGGGLA